MREVAAVLAAGASRRLGASKQLLRLPNGTPLLRHSVEQALAVVSSVSVIVNGHSVADLEGALRGLEVTLLPSEAPEEGVAASIRVAAAWAAAQGASALLLCVCDQPLLTAQHLAALLRAWRSRQGLAASFYAKKPGVPAVFPRQYFAALQALRGDSGAKAVLAAAKSLELVAWPDGAFDIDTAADWEQIDHLTRHA